MIPEHTNPQVLSFDASWKTGVSTSLYKELKSSIDTTPTSSHETSVSAIDKALTSPHKAFMPIADVAP